MTDKISLPINVMQTIEIKTFDSGSVKKQIDQFSKVLKSGKPLTAKDLQLYDQLFEIYKSLKYGPTYQKTVIPAKTKLIIPLNSYCLDSNKAGPDSNEVLTWAKLNSDIPYLSEILKLSSDSKYNHQIKQELIWNLRHKAYWENYPEIHKSILRQIDINAERNLPSESKNEIVDILKSEIMTSLPTQVQDGIEIVKGHFSKYSEIKEQIENRKSYQSLSNKNRQPIDNLSNVYTSNQSDSYSSQIVSFYNLNDQAISLNLNDYIQTPLRTDVQRIAAYFKDNVDSSELLRLLEKLLYSDMAKYGYGFIPVFNDLVDLAEVTSGENFFTNDVLSTQDRFLSALALIAGNAEAIRQAAKVIHGPASYADDIYKKYRNIKNEQSYKALEKLADELKNKGIPDNWSVKVSKVKKNTDQGLEFIHPDNPNARIRVMPGNPNSPHVNSQTKYVKVSNGNTFYDKNGKPRPYGSEKDIHIPFDKFSFERFKEVFR